MSEIGMREEMSRKRQASTEAGQSANDDSERNVQIAVLASQKCESEKDAQNGERFGQKTEGVKVALEAVRQKPENES